MPGKGKYADIYIMA